MFFYHLLKRKKSYNSVVENIYAAIIKQSRQPVFFERYDVLDTTQGRYEILMVHLFLVIERLRREKNEHAPHISQLLFDFAFADLDQNLRQIGVGDLSVPKQVKAMAQGFYGRSVVYLDALEKGDDRQLKDALKRNLFAQNEDVSEASLDFFVEYIKHQSEALAQNSFDRMLLGHVDFAPIEQASNSR